MFDEHVVTALRDVILASEDLRAASAAAFGLNVRDAAAVSYLRSRAELSQSELADIMCLTSPAITALVDRLERTGFVTRSAHSTDRRRIVLRLTDKSQRVIEQSRQWLLDAATELAAIDNALTVLSAASAGMRAQARAIRDITGPPAAGGRTPIRPAALPWSSVDDPRLSPLPGGPVGAPTRART